MGTEAPQQQQNQAPATGTAEQIQAHYVSPEYPALMTGEKVFRVEVSGLRHYQREGGRIYKSLTSFLDSVLPPSKHLQKWREAMVEELGSGEALQQYMSNVADYGTALHIAVAEYCRTRVVDWAEAQYYFHCYLSGLGLNSKTVQIATDEAVKDLAAIVQFIQDYRVTVLAVEIPVFSGHGVATLIDLVVEMDAKNYDKTPDEKRQRIKAGINLKSGKKGFHENHIFQLEGERRMFNETYGKDTFEIVEMYNLAPKDWKGQTPTYDLKRQTDACNAIVQEYDLYLQLGGLRGVLSEPKRTFTHFAGKTEYGQSPANSISIVSYAEHTGRFLK